MVRRGMGSGVGMERVEFCVMLDTVSIILGTRIPCVGVWVLLCNDVYM
jgi:hypothetical protein